MDSVLRLLLLLLAGYVTLCVAVYFLQDRLIFYPSGIWQAPRGEHVEPVRLQRPDAALRGWIVQPDAAGPLLIYFGGNAEELSPLVNVFARLQATTVLINYRGYGDSEGRPSAAALVDDAGDIASTMRQKYGSERPLILFGRSIGSGIAAQVARSVPADGLILMSPFRSLTHLAREVFPWLPARWLLRHRIDVIEALDALPEKTLVLYSPDDRIVPPAESRALLGLFNRPPQVAEFRGGHNVPLTHPEVWAEIAAFVRSVAPERT